MSNKWFMTGYPRGSRYDAPPIVCPGGPRAPPLEGKTYTQIARPGARAPHVWLADGRSTLDLYGRGFVLLRLGPNAPAGEGLQQAAAEAGMPLEVVALAEPEVLGAYERRLVLVRPDGHVAWRDDAEPRDARAVIDCLRGAGPLSAAARLEVAS